MIEGLLDSFNVLLEHSSPEIVGHLNQQALLVSTQNIPHHLPVHPTTTHDIKRASNSTKELFLLFHSTIRRIHVERLVWIRSPSVMESFTFDPPRSG